MIRRLLIVGFVLTVLFMAQAAGIGAVFGAQPNFSLVLLLGITYFPARGRNTWGTLFFGVVALELFVFAFFPFFAFQTAVMLVAVLCAAYTRQFLTGNYYADIGIGLLGATILFYAVRVFFSLESVVPTVLAVEFFYNYALGCAAGYLGLRGRAPFRVS